MEVVRLQRTRDGSGWEGVEREDLYPLCPMIPIQVPHKADRIDRLVQFEIKNYCEDQLRRRIPIPKKVFYDYVGPVRVSEEEARGTLQIDVQLHAKHSEHKGTSEETPGNWHY